MKKFLILLLFPAFAFITGDCGEYRYENKVLIDKDGMKAYNSAARNTSIVELVAQQRPEKEELGKHRAAIESTKVTITAYIIAYGKEDDRDYHLVLSSAKKDGETMIGEIPDPTCEKLKDFSKLQKDYKKARGFVEKQIDPTPSAVKPLLKPIKVIITGIPFYDKVSHGTGHSENGIEVHPILSIKKAKN